MPSQESAREPGSARSQAAPTLTNQASEQVRRASARFEGNLRQIAVTLANDESAEHVLKLHVNKALLTLKENGLKAPGPPKRFWQRQDFKVGVGMLILTIGTLISGLSRDVLESEGQSISQQPFKMWVFVISPVILFSIVGVCLAAYGWMQSPEHPRKERPLP